MGHGLVIAWTEFGHRTAVVAGMCVALGSLMQHCPLWVASIRGAGTIVVVVLLVHGIARVLASSAARDRELARARVLSASESAAVAKAPSKNGALRG